MTEQRFNHKIPRRTFLKVCAAAAAAGLTACGKTQAAAALPELTVGSDNYPPFIYLNNDSTPTGIDVDIATEAFARIGYAVRFEIIDWEQKTNLVESGAIDCIWSCFSMDGREQLYRWVGPYMVSRQVVAVNADSGIETLADLAGKTMMVQSTTKPEEIFLAGTDPRIPQFGELLSAEDRSVQYAMLNCGYVDAIAAHEAAILQYMQDCKCQFPHSGGAAAGHRHRRGLCAERHPRAGRKADRDLCRHARRRHDEADRRQVSAGPGKISGGGRP